MRGRPVLLLFAIVGVTAALGFRPGEETKPKDTPMRRTLIEARRLIRVDDAAAARRILKCLDHKAMVDDEERLCFLLSQDAATRLGDRVWMAELQKGRTERYAFGDAYLMWVALDRIQAADYKEARKSMASIVNYDGMEERDKRRYMALMAKLEQFDGTPEGELKIIDRYVVYPAMWDSSTCQSCHENRKEKGKPTFLDLREWWVGRRYASLLAQLDRGERARNLASAALTRNPDDRTARLRFAFALRATGQRARADAELAKLPFIPAPGRDRAEPEDFLRFPYPDAFTHESHEQPILRFAGSRPAFRRRLGPDPLHHPGPRCRPSPCG